MSLEMFCQRLQPKKRKKNLVGEIGHVPVHAPLKWILALAIADGADVVVPAAAPIRSHIDRQAFAVVAAVGKGTVGVRAEAVAG